jgi:drug/metabolite transporter (DMT)-like permease
VRQLLQAAYRFGKNKCCRYFIWIICIAPFGGIVSKTILKTLNPISFQLITNSIIALIFIILFFKSIKRVPKKAYFPLILTNILTTIAWILYFFSYKESGIVYTVLIFSIQPLLVYFTSIILLKEKANAKKIIAFIIILIAIALAQII